MLDRVGLADDANRYIDENKPWVMAKDEASLPKVQAICTQGINLFRSLIIYLTPVLPDVAAKAREFLAENDWHWDDASTPLLGATLAPFKPLLTRVESAQIDNMVEQSKQS